MKKKISSEFDGSSRSKVGWSMSMSMWMSSSCLMSDGFGLIELEYCVGSSSMS